MSRTGAPVGANKAAMRLAVAAHRSVHRDDIEALAAQGLLDPVGEYKGWPTYDPREIAALPGDPDALDALTDLVAERLAWCEVSLDALAAAHPLGLSIAGLDALAAERGITPGPLDRYAQADIDSLATTGDDAERVRQDGLRPPGQARQQLGIGQDGLGQLVADGLIAPAAWIEVDVWVHHPRTVDLYRTGDLDTLHRPVTRIEWRYLDEEVGL